ncbi:MAG: hypothetical protein EBR81_11605, partial [Proteobacteria bacterium]|nr:hypothetical protein [Pseudomonadota bacterium]
GNLVFSGADNVLTDGGTATFLRVGSPLANVLNSLQYGQYGTVILRNSNNFSGGMQVAKSNTLQIETGAGPNGQTPLGAGFVEVYGTLQNSGIASSFVNGLTGFNSNNIVLRPGGTVTLNNQLGVQQAGGNGLWTDSGTFQLSAGNAPSTETIGTVAVSKAGQITVTKGSGVGYATLTLAGLTRNAPGTVGAAGWSTVDYAGAGVLQLNTGTANNLGVPTGTATTWERIVLAGGLAGSSLSTGGSTNYGIGVTNTGILAPWIINTKDNTFVGYNVAGGAFGGDTGFQPLISYTASPGLGQIAYSSNTLASSLLTDTVDVTGATSILSAANLNSYALRTTGNITLAAPTVPSTLTIASGGLIATAASTVGTITSNVADLLTVNFGVSGGTEAVIYITTGSITFNAKINAAGITKAGAGALVIPSVNPGITAPVTLNAGGLYLQNTLDGTTGNTLSPIGNQPLILNGGQLNVDSGLGTTTLFQNPDGFRRAMTTFNSDIYVNADASIYGYNANNVNVYGVNNAAFAGQSVFGGSVTGGLLNKYGQGYLLFAGTSNSFSGLVINADSTAGQTSLVGSLTRTGTPFGSGSITVNPGAMLRIADPSNLTTGGSNAVTILSDGAGLSGLGLAGNFAPPSFTVVDGTSSATANPGQILFKSSGDYAGVLALDTYNYTQTLNMGALGGGKMWLGTSVIYDSVGWSGQTLYFNPTLTPGSADTVATAPIYTGSTASTPVYRLGGGGVRGFLQIGASAYENVLTGLANVQIGAIPTANAAAGTSYVNGNIGGVNLLNRNDLATGSMVFVNRDSNLAIGNAFALGNATLVLNGGNVQVNAPILNSVSTISDSFTFSNGSTTNSVLRGNLNLSPSGVGGTRTINTSQVDATIQGVVSGTVGTNLIKGGANGLMLSGLNTYLGTTTVTTSNNTG